MAFFKPLSKRTSLAKRPLRMSCNDIRLEWWTEEEAAAVLGWSILIFHETLLAAELAVAKLLKSAECSSPGRHFGAAGRQFSFRYWRSFSSRSDMLLKWRKPCVRLELSSLLHL
jgi:hypothetical protein